MNIVEKRTEKRVKSILPISLMTQDNPSTVHAVSSFNISVDGICLQTNLALSQNEQIDLEIPTSLGKLQLHAVVVWTKLNEYGCQFIDIDATTKRKLAQWLFPPFEP